MNPSFRPPEIAGKEKRLPLKRMEDGKNSKRYCAGSFKILMKTYEARWKSG